MCRNRTLLVSAIACSLIFAGCGERDSPPTESADEETTRTDRLKFGEVTVRQVSDQIVAAGENGIRPAERKLRYHSAMAAHATAVLDVDRCNYPGDPNFQDAHDRACSTCEHVQEDSLGSGTLSSYSRIPTAFHNVAGKLRKDDVDGEIAASFARPYLNPNRQNNSLDDIEEGKWHKTGCQNCRLNFLVATRLYTLGLPQWAKNTEVAAIRQYEASEWRYIKGVSYYERQGAQKRDYAILYPEPKKLQSPWPDGRLFAFSGPGIIFDSLGTAHPHVKDVDPGEKLWSSVAPFPKLTPMHTAYNVGQPDYISRQLVSQPGYVAQEPEYSNSDLSECIGNEEYTCWRDNPGDDFMVHSPTYSNTCFPTSIDAVRGCSGGAVSAVRIKQESPERLYSLGVIQSISATESDSTTNEQWSEFRDTDGLQYPTEQYYTSVVGITDEIFRESSLDYFYKAVPSEYKTGFPSAIADSFKELNSTDFFQPGSDYPDGCDRQSNPSCYGYSPQDGTDGSIGWGKDRDRGQVELRGANCAAPFSWHSGVEDARVGTGFALGLFGAPTVPVFSVPSDQLEVAPNLGQWGVICGPWSEAAWTYNWADLTYFGFRKTGDVLKSYSPSVLENNQLKPVLLRYLLGDAFEVRREGFYNDYQYVDEPTGDTSGKSHDLLTPPSALMCPPGYALSGFRFISRPCIEEIDRCESRSDARSIIRGFDSIQCTPVPESAGSSRIEVPTVPASDDADEFGHRFGGREVTVGQHIGLAEFLVASDKVTLHSCPPGEAIQTISVDQEEVSPDLTTAIQFRCVDIPD